jgi:hypothetical protein
MWMALYNAEKLVSVCEKGVNVHMYCCRSLKSVLCTILKRATFLERPRVSSPAWNHPCLPWCSPQPANKQKKIRVKYFCWQLIAPILSDLYLSTRSSSLGTISCCETLTYFKYTPVKAKNKNNYQYSFCVVICNLDHTAMLTNCCFCTTNMLSLQIIQDYQFQTLKCSYHLISLWLQEW